MIDSEKILEFIKETVGSLEPEEMETALGDIESVFDGEVFHSFEMFKREGDASCFGFWPVDEDADLWQSKVYDVSEVMDKVKHRCADQNIYRVMVDDEDLPEYKGYLSVWFVGTSEDDVVQRLQVAWKKYQANEG